MKNDKLEKLLYELGEQREPVRKELCNEIKQQIPHRLLRHKFSWDTVSIIIDLRMSRSTAAAIIIIAMILLLNVFSARDPVNGGILHDGALLIQYLRGEKSQDIAAAKAQYELLSSQGQDVTWYGDNVDKNKLDSSTVLIQIKLPDGRYKLIFADGHEKEVASAELVEILTVMLKRGK
jgi:hypothetical protein